VWLAAPVNWYYNRGPPCWVIVGLPGALPGVATDHSLFANATEDVDDNVFRPG
jgi:hypothetical protein